LVSPAQLYEHLPVELSHLPTWPDIIGHWPSEQQASLATHLPLQSFWAAGQLYLHWSAEGSQVAIRPAWAGQSSMVQQAPQRAVAPSPHFLPCSHVKPHVFPSQVAVPPAGATHGWHDVPQEFGSLLATHRLLQLWVPGVLQFMSQGVP